MRKVGGTKSRAKLSFSPDPSLERIKNVIRGNPSQIRKLFSDARSSTQPSRYRTLVDTFYDNPFYKAKLFGDMFPQSPSAIKRVQPLNGAGAERELMWATSIIEHYAKNASVMIASKSNVERLVLEGKLSDAKNSLNEFEEKYGLSLWGYSVRFYICEQMHGSDANNEIYRSIRQAPGLNGYTYFLIFYMGFRTSPGSTVQHIRDQIPEPSLGYTSLSIYVKNKLSPFEYDEREVTVSDLVEAMLIHETNSSLLDLSLATFKAIRLAIDDGDDRLRNCAFKCLGRLNTVLPNANIAYAGQTGGLLRAVVYDAKSDAVMSAMDEVVQASFNLSEGRGQKIIDALGWSKVEGPSVNHLDRELSELFGPLFMREEGRALAAGEIERICTILSEIDAAHSIFSLAQRLWSTASSLSLFSSLSGVVLTGCDLPDLSQFIEDDNQALLYLKQLEEVYGSRPSINIFKKLRGADICGLPEKVDAFVDALRYIAKNNYKEALDKLSLVQTDDNSLGLAASSVKANLLLDEGKTSEAVQHIVRTFLLDRGAWAALPVQRAIQLALEDDLLDKSTMEYAILLDIEVKFFDEVRARQRSYAVEDAWEARSVDLPSEIATSITREERLTAVYYLERLCTSDILSDSDRFQSVRALEEERVRVCQALIDLNPEETERYLSEIKAVTRWLVIYDGLRSVEQSKIYVDVDGLKSHLASVVGPEFDRMLALRRERAAFGDVTQLALQEMVTYRDDNLIGKMLIKYAEDDPAKILQHIVSAIWHEFASNSHFGLDVYLSTRIRHGTLKGYLRSPLEESHLICQRIGDQYQQQSFWDERAKQEGEHEFDLQTALKEFSKEIDLEIATLNGESLRLKTEDNPGGWFEVAPLITELVAIERFLDRESVSVSEFLDVVFAHLNSRLAATLRYVRWEIHSGCRPRWSERLRTLRDLSSQISSPQLKGEFEAASADAQVAIDLAFERVAGWFTLSAARQNPDYNIDLAIGIAAKSIENCFGVNVLEVHHEDAEGPHLQGRTLASLVDMFFIVFENIVKHSRPPVGESPKAVASVSLSREEGLFNIVIRNTLPSGADRSKVMERVNQIKDSLKESSEVLLVTEGGTGFHKLRKILTSDLGIEHEFDFGVDGDDFEVSVLLDAGRVTA